jgi:hypothetical protein
MRAPPPPPAPGEHDYGSQPLCGAAASAAGRHSYASSGGDPGAERCLLSSLPPTLLELIASRVDAEWKHSLRLTCRHARAAVNATTRTLSLARHPALARPREQPLPPAVSAAVRAVFPNVTTLVLRDQITDFLGEPSGEQLPASCSFSGGSCCLSPVGSLSPSSSGGGGCDARGSAKEGKGAADQRERRRASIAAALHAAGASGRLNSSSSSSSSSTGGSSLLGRSHSRSSLFSSDESSSSSSSSSSSEGGGCATSAPGPVGCHGSAASARALHSTHGSFLSVRSAASHSSSDAGCSGFAAGGAAPAGAAAGAAAAGARVAAAAAPPQCGGGGCGCDVVRAFCLGPALAPHASSWSALSRVVMHFEALTGVCVGGGDTHRAPPHMLGRRLA